MKRPSDQRKLSDVARHIKRPQGIVSTGWGPVRERAAKMGMRCDRWQDGLGRLALAKRADGLYAAGIGGVIMSIPRQVGKTYLISLIVFALCSLFPNLTVIWTAHRTRTHNETFKKMQSTAGKPRVAPWIANVRATNGEQEITFKNGSRILFGARESGFGRGFDMVDILVLDEAQILTEDAMTDMVPATNASPNGLVFMMGTPPRPRDNGEVFTNARRDALGGDPDRLYVELSADPDAKVNDREQLAKANPSYPERTTEAAILRMKKLLGSDENFKREGYGIWDEIAGEKLAISPDHWERRVIDPADAPDGTPSYAVKFSLDGATIGLAAARKPEDGPVHVVGIREAMVSEGTEWLVDWLVERHSGAAQIVIDGKSGVGYLVNALRDAGVRNKRLIIVPNTEQVTSAHSMMDAAIRQGGMTTQDQPEVQAVVDVATRRDIGTNGGFGWAAPEGHSTVLLDAMTYAFWAAKTSTRKPGRKAVFA